MTTQRRSFGGAVFACLLLFGADAPAQQASITLSQDAALWNESIQARIEGTGCSGDLRGPYFTPRDGGGILDIDLTGCNPSTDNAFVTTVDLGDSLPPGVYTVRVFDIARHIASPPIPPFDSETVTIYRRASLDLDVIGVPTDAERVRLRLSGTTRSCGNLSTPVVKGNVIELTWDDRCVDPSKTPSVWEREIFVGPLAAGEYEIRFFERLPNGELPVLHRETLTVYDADRCVPGPETLCVQNGRFKVDVAWEDFTHRTGAGHAVPLAGRNDSGLFWFFDEKNVELTVKVLGGCAVNNKYWVFLSSGTTVRYVLTVTDTMTGASRVYANALGESAPLKADTAAFSCTN